MSAGANTRVKLFSALNVLGWVVVMPALLVAIMNPFVNFSAWPDALADRTNGTQVALMPPRLSEHGSLPQLTEAPAPSAAVPVHREIVATFTPAPASSPARRGNGTTRAQGRRPASTRRRVSAPARSRRPVSNRSGRPALRSPAAATPVVTPSAPSKPSQSAGNPQPKPEQARPDNPEPGPGKPHQPEPSKPQNPGNGKPENPGNGNGNGNGGKTEEPQQAGPGKTQNAQGEPESPQQGNGNGNGKGGGKD